LKGIKAAAASMGLCKNILIPPLQAGDEKFNQTIEKRTGKLLQELNTLL
jgi:hypothetical protein